MPTIPAWAREMAAAAGCDPLAVTLIRQHQERVRRGAGERGSGGDGQRSIIAALGTSDTTLKTILADRLLAAMQAADDDN